MISIQNLHAEVMARQSKRYEIYEEVFQKVVSKIKYENTKSDTCYCLYKLPVWVFGVPLYNLGACAEYIINRLKEHYFQVNFMPPNILHIYWNVRPHSTHTYINQNNPMLTQLNSQPNLNINSMTMNDLQNAKQLAINPMKNKQSIFAEIDKAFLETSSGILTKPTGDPRFNRSSKMGLSIDDLRNQKPPDLNDVLSALDFK
jgi:hypothetical protein